MVAHHIHDALGQIHRLQELILEKRKFRGYSGSARMAGGAVTALGCVVMSSSLVPRTVVAHVIGWMLLAIVAMALNYGALVLWYIQLPNDERKVIRVKPVLDALPPLLIAAPITAALLLRGYPDLLFGLWMCLYGLAHTSCRRDLPRANWLVGIYYLLFGAFFMMWQKAEFLTPWPMGVVFLIGESVGGIIFHRHKYSEVEVAS
jgi:hypothetical protein